MSFMMERIAEKKGEKPVLTSFNVYNLTRNNQYDSTKAREELGYSTRPYEETIRDMIDWLYSEGIIKDEEE
jgi:dihydroflavonol-4-reductase